MSKKFNKRTKEDGKYGRKSEATNSKNSKSGSRYGKGSARSTNADCDSKNYGGNDFSWYNRNSSLIESAARIPFPYKPGTIIPLSGTALNSESVIDSNFRYPGIAAIYFSPSIGYTDNAMSPANIATMEIYGKVREAYSGSLAVDPPDIMMYMLALDSIYMLIENFKRAYYISTSYSGQNYYLPATAMTAMGFSYSDFRSNATLIEGYISQLIAAAREFKLPAQWDLFHRHAFMCSNIYADNDDISSQMYEFIPVKYWQVENTETQTKLVSKPVFDPGYVGEPEGAMPASMYFSMIWDAIKALKSWDDTYTINGYLQRAFQDTPSFTISDLVPGATLLPVYNPEVLMQIQNITPMGYSNVAGNYDVTYDAVTGILRHQPKAWTGSYGKIVPVSFNNIPIVMKNMGTPTTAEVTVGTRLTAYRDASGYIHCGTEIVHQVTYMMLKSHKTKNNLIPELDIYPSLSAWHDSNAICIESIEGDLVSNVKFLIDYTATASVSNAWRYHPSMFLFIGQVTSPASIIRKSFMNVEVDNVSTIALPDLDRLHEICIYSEFNCFPDNKSNF